MYKMMMAALVALGLIATSFDLARAEPLGGRVEEELLSDGISLARLGQRLELREHGTSLDVALIDRTTGKTLASRSVDKLPADPAAAVAQLTVMVAAMLRERGLVPAPGGTGDWASTFSAAAVVAYHRPASIAVVAVTRPGRLGEQTRAAAAALVAAYRAAGVATVNDGTALGEVGDVEDAAIVTRAAALSVEHIAIVRAFIEGPSARAIVTIYSASKQLVTGFSAVAGQPLAAPAAEHPPRDAAAAAAALAPRPEPAASAALLDKDGVVRLWVRPNDPQLQLLRATGVAVMSGGASAVRFSEPLCRAPCGEVVDGSLGEPFVFGIMGAPRTHQFQLTGLKGDVTATVRTSKPLQGVGGLALLGAGGVFAISGALFIGNDELRTEGTVMLIGGVAAAVTGYFLRRDAAPSVTLTPGHLP